ncbi:MAG: hypothetical protein V4559_00030 [Pseudomonadota bacterium]
MSLTYRDQIFMTPLARRHDRRTGNDEEHGIGRSPRFAPGLWLTGAAIFYIAVAALCIFLL